MIHLKVQRFIHIYPWYIGLTSDLLFYIAIDTLFLTVVKNLTAAQIVSLTSVSTIGCIILQFPALWVIQKLGNTASIRIGAFLMLLAALCVTFGTNYYFIVFGILSRGMATLFSSASYVALENNLELIDRRQDFVRVRTAGNTNYAVLTMLISFIASPMFNHNNYLPMLCCTAASVIGFILSFFTIDHSAYNKIPQVKRVKHGKMHYSKLILLAIVVYGLFYPIVTSGQTDGKLFIQQHLLLDFDVENTSLIIGAILCASRIIRVISNLLFAKIYQKYQEKVGVFLPAFLCTAVGLMILGSLLPHVLLKILIMGIGYTIILFLRDPFRLYIQDVVFINTAKEYHQTLLTMLEFSVKLGTAAMSLGFTLILLKYPMLLVMSILFVIAVIEVIFSICLYRCIVAGKQAKPTLAETPQE